MGKKVTPKYKFKRIISKYKELLFSTVTSLVFCFILFKIDIYKNFSFFLPAFQNLCIYIGTGLISFIGIIITGIAVVISLLNKEILNEIDRVNEEKNEKNDITGILKYFKICTIHAAIQIGLFYLMYLVLYSPNNLVGVEIFFILLFSLTFYFIYLIFYIIGLVSMCIKLFEISKIYTKIIEERKNNENE